MFSSEEVELAKNAVNNLTALGSQTYILYVQGTQLVGMTHFIEVIFIMFISIIMGGWAMSTQVREMRDKQEKKENKIMAFACGFIITFFILSVIMIFTYQSIDAMVAPQYVVINNIVGKL